LTPPQVVDDREATGHDEQADDNRDDGDPERYPTGQPRGADHGSVVTHSDMASQELVESDPQLPDAVAGDVEQVIGAAIASPGGLPGDRADPPRHDVMALPQSREL
jgi:hypothetical protein